MNLLVLFSTLGQSRLPYHIAGVESNDSLYGGDGDYLQDIQDLINKLLETVLEEIAKYSKTPETTNAVILLVAFFFDY